jgi:hypothetical protein
MWIIELAPTQMRAVCKGCYQQILWVVTKDKKKAPINPDYKVLSRTLISGAEVGQAPFNLELIEIPNEASHFATCEMRDQFRKGKKA